MAVVGIIWLLWVIVWIAMARGAKPVAKSEGVASSANVPPPARACLLSSRRGLRPPSFAERPLRAVDPFAYVAWRGADLRGDLVRDLGSSASRWELERHRYAEAKSRTHCRRTLPVGPPSDLFRPSHSNHWNCARSRRMARPHRRRRRDDCALAQTAAGRDDYARRVRRHLCTLRRARASVGSVADVRQDRN